MVIIIPLHIHKHKVSIDICPLQKEFPYYKYTPPVTYTAYDSLSHYKQTASTAMTVLAVYIFIVSSC